MTHVKARPFTQFIQIPGPNPILVPGAKGKWDDHLLEACDIFKDGETYYFYYHATSQSGRSYVVGVATAPHPLGPWTKSERNPVLDQGSKGSWDDNAVACAFIHKENIDGYYMFYSGRAEASDDHNWSVGLATAKHPLGPWEKITTDRSLIEGFGYVGGVVKAQGRYWMYNEYPISSTGEDYGTMSLATASSPEGPWKIYEEGPIIGPGEWGAWDDGGYSEAKVFYRDGVFHLFYGGVKLDQPRFSSRESIGYAYSFDGIHFTKYTQNPVALRDRNPDAAAFAEVHAYYEPPFVYCFHTLRYCSRLHPKPYEEELGVQVLATERPFCLPMSALTEESLKAKASTALEACPPLSLEHASQAALTVSCLYDSKASAGLKLHVKSSYDGFRYDSGDFATFDDPAVPGELCQSTFSVNCSPRFIKVVVENPDPACKVQNLNVTLVLKG